MSLLLLNNKYKFSTVGTNYFINVKKYLLINKHTVEEYYRNKIDRVNNNILKDIINDLYSINDIRNRIIHDEDRTPITKENIDFFLNFAKSSIHKAEFLYKNANK